MNLNAFFGAKIWRCANSLNFCRYALALLCISVFCACGYLPTSKVANNIFSDRIYVNVEISQQDSRNSIYIVDTIRELVINKLGKSPSLKEEADESIDVKMESLTFTPIIYDENGYVIAYKTRVTLFFNVVFKDKQKESVRTSGDYDFAISPNSVISDSARFEAIRFASSEAFDEFVSLMAIKGHQNGKY